MRGSRPAILLGVSVLIIVAVVVGIVASQSGKNKTSDNMANMPGMNMPVNQMNSSNSNNNAKSPVASDNVSIQNFAFSPASITVKAGATVTWTNSDSTIHSVTPDSGSPSGFGSGDLGSGQTYQFTFATPGTYHYHCTKHPYMHGIVVVTR